MKNNSIKSNSKEQIDLKIAFFDLYVYLEKKTFKTSEYEESRMKVLKKIEKYKKIVVEMQKNQELIFEVNERKERSSYSSVEEESGMTKSFRKYLTEEFSSRPNRDSEEAIKIIEKLSTADRTAILMSESLPNRRQVEEEKKSSEANSEEHFRGNSKG